MSYITEAKKTISEKITLVTVECVERVKLFTANGADWDRVSSHFVVGVKDGATSIGTWTYSPTTGVLKILGGANPSTRDLSLTYRKFFSNAPVIAPYDLTTGADVEWVACVSVIGSLGQQLDDQSTGIVLESSSSVDFINSGYWDLIFDKMIWENQSIKFYSWIYGTPITDKLQVFDGIIESKSYSETKVSFKVKDFIYKLRNKLNMESFSALDGSIEDSIIATPKRRIYGKADHVQCTNVDSSLDGFDSTGTVSGTIGTNILTGVGTSFLTSLSPEDDIAVTFGATEIKFSIESISSDTSLVVGKLIESSIVGATLKVNPKIASRYKNRNWLLSGDELHEAVRNITAVRSGNRFELDSVENLFAGDPITVYSFSGNTNTTIRRISGNEVVTDAVILPTPSVTDVIARSPVQDVYFGTRKLTDVRDYYVYNSGYGECSLGLNSLAEFNITEPIGLATSLIFVNGTRTITTAATIDLRTILKTRDWIRSSTLSEPDWYEILDVKEQTITLRTAFTGASGTKTSFIKNIVYIEKDSLITASCFGTTDTKLADGNWLKTPSDVVRDIILNDANFSAVNETSFTKADADCDYILSLVLPEGVNGNLPTISDTLTKVNESVFGAIYGTSSTDISFSILNADRPESIKTLYDDDILSYSVQTNQKIINQVKINYSPFIDIVSGEDAFQTLSYTSTFVDKYIGIKNSQEKTIYLYETDKAEIIAQRICFFNSLSNSTVTLKGKLNLSDIGISDKLYLDLDRMYTGYGYNQAVKVGIVSGYKRSDFGCEITVIDLSGVYNRVMSIAPNTTGAYFASSAEERIKWAYIVDNNLESPDVLSENGLGSYLIG
jgi:hypothetical protein